MAALVAAGACGGAQRLDRRFDWLEPSIPAVTITVDVGPPGTHLREPYHYTVRREPSGVTVDLHAIEIVGQRAYAAGDGGLVLCRTAWGNWEREPTPTTRRLRALVAVESAGLYAVGDAGTVLFRSADGRWTVEPVPTTADLYDIVEVDRVLYAVGDRGTLLARSDGAWRTIATNTEADLRRFDGHIAVGRGGAIVDCATSDRDQAELAHQLACVPSPSPTTADLLAISDDATTWRAFGADGASVRAIERHPFGGARDAPVRRGATVTATAGASSATALVFPSPVTVLVGMRGLVVFSAERLTYAVLPGEPDLFGAAQAMFDVFAVGAGGTIVHFRAIDVREDEVILI